MKLFNALVKIATTLAAIAGVIYVIATYGDEIVTWSKALIGRIEGEADISEETIVSTEKAEPEAEAISDIQEAEASVADSEVNTDSVLETENSPVADETDFEG